MTDIVNSFFRKHYPTDAETAWVTRQCVRSYAREYNGAERDKRTFPRMVCADGFSMSVQGHFGAYSTPRGDFEPHYYAVEVATDPRAEPLFVELGGEDYDTFSLYGYVPVELVCRVIEKHGGLAPTEQTKS